MSHITYVELKRYFPTAVKRVITIGSSCWIGEVDDSTVLKYPHARGEEADRFQTEYKILHLLGQHPRIIGLKGYTEDGLYLERAVIHCDIRPRNLLLDKQLSVKLADFQGQHLSADGEVLLNGLSSEPSKYSCPRDVPDHADVHTDLFALGSTIYFIMLGHDIFPDLSDQDDGSDEEVQRRFRARHFPRDDHACSAITAGCWARAYGSAIDVVRDVELVEKKVIVREMV